ncbi:sulfotransferase domain-containing protein [Cobetia marina]|uniref:sulfotransferase domain-containing protein n=1 Tax=Cobetia marina TaxID=28258 RepID=UPI0025485B22|nr:sulfotransferase domain-containing protein [Cobetia pacifica]MDI6004295.1 sulfotransferase domain-containing protein [Cobetia pacifica]
MIENLLLCVGAQKAGTTWLNAQLNDHPDIAFSDVKEVHYFNTIHNGSILLTRRKVEHMKRVINNNPHAVERYYSDLSSGRMLDQGLHRLFSPVDDKWYISLFQGVQKKYCADFTPEYALIGQEGFKNVKEVSKSQKIIFMMRDPLDRALSAIRYFYKMHNVDINDKSEDEILQLATSDLILNMSRYERTIEDLKSCFDPDDTLYLFYEDVMANKQQAIDSVCDFLDIRHVTLAESRMNKRVNATDSFDIASSIQSSLLDCLKDTYKYIHSSFDTIPKEWVRL